MCNDLLHFDEPKHRYNAVTDQIEYLVMDSYCPGIIYGYRTAFAYLKHSLRNNEANISRALRLRVSCGQFSYADVHPQCILGVSGTLASLGEYEWRVMGNYGLSTYTLLPSVYGETNFRFLSQQGSNPICITATDDDFHQAITREVSKNQVLGRAVMVFFKDNEHLDRYMETNFYRSVSKKGLLREGMSNSQKQQVVKSAATSGQATFTTAIFGRGTDFCCQDRRVWAAGGVHVVQAFVAGDKSEEQQIQGRTARQGKDGTYCMVLLADELKRIGLSIDASAANRVHPAELYDQIQAAVTEQCRATHVERDQKMKEAADRNVLTQQFFDALLDGNASVATSAFTKFYDSIPTKIPSGVAQPQAGARVHFSGALMSDHFVAGWSGVPYQPDSAGEYVGIGEYPRNREAFPQSIAQTFDSVAIDAGTRVTIYSEPDFQGDVLWDQVGPRIVCNVLYQTQWPELLTTTWTEPLNTMFPPDVREWSGTNMHLWDSGSLVIEDGEPIPQFLKDALPEYACLDNATY